MRRPGRPGHPPGWWAEIARVYNDACAEDRPPTKAVREHLVALGYSPHSASQNVNRARERGLIPPTSGKGDGCWRRSTGSRASIRLTNDELLQMANAGIALEQVSAVLQKRGLV